MLMQNSGMKNKEYYGIFWSGQLKNKLWGWTEILPDDYLQDRTLETFGL